ncbi:MAG: Gfo/Idh/MocA family oxidoreductase [Cyclobacteriaceae bacterium]|nr:Gfo/Idh/MocA family oxidoreductase [Cyclobacteriaceae bacterium]
MNLKRRKFLKKSAIGSIASFAIPAIIPSSVLGGTAPSNRINLAMIGCGRQTINPNIPQLLNSSHAKIVAVCDLDTWRLANAQKQVNDFYSKEKTGRYSGCKTMTDHREVMLDKDVDAVMIATPDHWHVPVAIEAARAGKHISLEKPISTCIGHGQKLIEAIKEHKVITRNDSEFRTLPSFHKAVELVRNGRIGKINRIYVAVPAELNGSALPPQPTAKVPAELNYDQWLGPAWEAPYTEKRVHDQKSYGRPGWMRVDAYCNGMISNWGAHLMGIAQWGNNTEYTGPILIEGTGQFDKGLWNTLNQFDIRYEYANGVELFYKIERPYVRFEGAEGWVEVEYPDKLSASSKEILDSVIKPNEMLLKDIPSDKEDFLISVKENSPSLEPLETAHRTISMCQLGLISVRVGTAVKWDPDSQQIVEDNAASAMLDIPIREKYFKF